MKCCTKCSETKPLEEFPPNKRMKDGRASWCRECARAARRDWERRHGKAYYAKNREKRVAEAKERRDNDPAVIKRREERASFTPKTDFSEWKREWRKENAERIADYQREWYAKNRDHVRPQKRNSEGKRRALKAKLPTEDVDPVVVFERDSGICGLCESAVDPNDWHMDHIIPLAAGGSHTYENVQVSHPRCNLSKGSRLAV